MTGLLGLVAGALTGALVKPWWMGLIVALVWIAWGFSMVEKYAR